MLEQFMEIPNQLIVLGAIFVTLITYCNLIQVESEDLQSIRVLEQTSLKDVRFISPDGSVYGNFYKKAAIQSEGIIIRKQEDRYIDSPAMYIHMKLQNISLELFNEEQKFQGQAKAVHYHWGQILDMKNCTCQLNLTLKDTRHLNVSVSSDECKIEILADLEEHLVDQMRAINLFLFILIPIIISLSSVNKLIKHFLREPMECKRVSLNLLFLILYVDVWLSFSVAYSGIQLMIFTPFAILLIFQGIIWFMIAVGLNMRLLVIVWKQYQDINSAEQMRIAIMKFYVRFYTGVIVYCLIMFRYGPSAKILFLHSFIYLLPIFHSIINGTSSCLYKELIFGMVGVKYLIPFYIRGCPENVLRLSPISWYCISSFLILSLSFTILSLQHSLGARFFIPRQCIPGYYNYEVQMDFISQEEWQEYCSICMLPLGEQQPQKKSIWRTPCMHSYHPQCIKGWIEIKLECPECRSKLPIP